MARISTYPIDTKISGGDKWIGTDVDKNNATKNFTVANVAEYLNVSSSIDSQTLRYKFQYLNPGDVREPGTISFDPQLGSSVPFSSVTTWLLSQYSKKYVSQGAANDISSFYTSPLIGSQVLVTNTKDISKDKYLIELTKTFQRRFRQELINGKIDQECLLISKSLIKAYN